MVDKHGCENEVKEMDFKFFTVWLFSVIFILNYLIFFIYL